jgi:hypothetical protein
VLWQPIPLVNGAPVVFRVAPPLRLESLSGKWLGHDVSFSLDSQSKTWYGIAGVSLETAAGVYALQLKGATASGKDISLEHKITVRRAHYPTVAVTVARQFTEPSAEQMQKINQDKAVKQDVFRSVGPTQEW